MATVIFKPTEACNARCIYCEVVKKTRGPQRMTFKTLELFFRRVNEYLLESPQEEMEIIWHGGEPLLLGPRYFEQAFRYQEKHCAETARRIEHSIQSNLTLLSREFLEPLRRLGITCIGSSYDPVSNIRGLGANRDWRAYNRRFLEAIGLLEEEGFNWGVVYVVTKQSLGQPLEIFNYLTNMSPRRGLRFNPILVYGEGLSHLKISPAEYAEFLGAIFPVWWRNQADFGHVEPFSSLVENLLGHGKTLTCTDSGACTHSHLNVGSDGRASHCGRSADWGVLDYGSIQEKSFFQIFADPQREILRRRNEVLPETECKDCRLWDICHGGCPLDAWFATGSFLHKSGWCHAQKELIETYIEPLVNGGEAQGDYSRKSFTGL
jgi:radical SAM protein with 4Fe4S-binding SPASM domain